MAEQKDQKQQLGKGGCISTVELTADSNQARGLAQYALRFIQGKLGYGPSAAALKRVELFHTDSVFTGIPAVALNTNATRVFREEAAIPWRDTPITQPEWYLISVGLGVLLGGLFRFFLRDEEDADKQFLSLVGIIVFSSGAAHYLELSPLLVNMALGFTMLFNAKDASSRALLQVLERTRGPMYIVLLIFAGAMWQPVAVPVLIFALIYALLRGGSRLASGWFSALTAGPAVRRDIGRGMLGQGEVAVAMALNFQLVYPDSPACGLVVTAVLASVLLNELWSARLLKGLLIDSGDIRAEVPDIAAEGG